MFVLFQAHDHCCQGCCCRSNRCCRCCQGTAHGQPVALSLNNIHCPFIAVEAVFYESDAPVVKAHVDPNLFFALSF